jgi:hypothetical protein
MIQLHKGLEVHLVRVLDVVHGGWRGREEFVPAFSRCDGWEGGEQIGMLRERMFAER